jgi:hypothetical protein
LFFEAAEPDFFADPPDLELAPDFFAPPEAVLLATAPLFGVSF